MFMLNSSIGRKFIQAISGAFLILFLLLHATINFFSVIDSFTGKFGIAAADTDLFTAGDGLFKLGCDFMSTPVISIMVPILALGFVIHILYGIWLTILNLKAGEDVMLSCVMIGSVDYPSDSVISVRFKDDQVLLFDGNGDFTASGSVRFI